MRMGSPLQTPVYLQRLPLQEFQLQELKQRLRAQW